MADTPRTKSALAALFADNTAGDISPQDLRDFLESMSLPFGEMYVSTPATTTTGSAGTFGKVAGTTTLGDANLFDMPANNRLRYTGTVPIKVLVTVTGHLDDFSGDPKDLRLYVYDDSGAAGATVAKSQFSGGVTNAIDSPPFALQAIVTLDTNDYVELHASATGFGSTDITNAYFQLTAQALFG